MKTKKENPKEVIGMPEPAERKKTGRLTDYYRENLYPFIKVLDWKAALK
jgi:hypothetical protein